MGDIADMISNGSTCQVCGEFMVPLGYPQTCRDCGGDLAGIPIANKRKKKKKPNQLGKDATK